MRIKYNLRSIVYRFRYSSNIVYEIRYAYIDPFSVLQLHLVDVAFVSSNVGRGLLNWKYIINVDLYNIDTADSIGIIIQQAPPTHSYSLIWLSASVHRILVVGTVNVILRVRSPRYIVCGDRKRTLYAI